MLALVLQKILLPMIPGMHAGHGLMKSDAIIFHDAAESLAKKINTIGWSEWKLMPIINGQPFTANVGVLAALYALMGPNPAAFIPLNAAAHATGALMIYLMGPLLCSGKIGRTGGAIAGIVFLIFPSALLWYGQNLKDAFAIAGILTMLCCWLYLQQSNNSTFSTLRILTVAGLASVLLSVFRPHFTIIIAVAFLISWLAFFCSNLFQKNPRKCWQKYLVLLFFVSIVGTVGFVASKSSSASLIYGESAISHESSSAISHESEHWKWKETPFLPPRIDAIFKRVSELRVHFIAYSQSVSSGSGVDEHLMPSDTLGVLSYMPRALFVGLFAPFPNSWSQRVTLPRLIGAIETAIWYFFFCGLIVLVWRNPSCSLISGIFFCATLLMVLDYTNPNIGTIYRERYGFWMFFLLSGAIGWVSITRSFLLYIEQSHQKGVPIFEAISLSPVAQRCSSLGLIALLRSSGITILITFLGYLGFLLRDLLLIQAKGLNSSTDSLFSAMMLPMVLVNCLALPMSDAVTMPFLKMWTNGDRSKSRQFIRQIICWGSLMMLASSAVCFILAVPAMRIILGSHGARQIADGALLMRLFAPIVFLSAWTIIGNAVLNSLHRFRDSSLASLSVPICAVTAILIAPSDQLAVYAIIGMVVGTLVNVIIVAILCQVDGITITPSAVVSSQSVKSVFRTYRWLVFASFFAAVVSPMNYFFAGTVGGGTVAGWAFSSKMVLLFNGLIVACITTVLLPHMARIINLCSVAQLGNYFVFLLFCGTWIGGIIVLAVVEFAEPIVAMLFNGSHVTEQQIQTLSHVIRIGVVQLPIVIVGTIMIKASALTMRSSQTVLASALSLVISVALSWILVPKIGMLGIAYASLGGALIGTLYLVLVMLKKCAMNMFMPCVLVMTWSIWALISFAVSSGWSLSIISIFFLLVLMGAGHFFVWHGRLAVVKNIVD
ncbi:MAG: lipid II flippase MurJ [bacterium]